MKRTEAWNAIVAANDLNEHPFYKAWREGTLPMEKLTDYAGEYGCFIASLADGWRTLGESAYADEEVRHAALWDDFRRAVGFRTRSDRPETTALVSLATELFAHRATAVGALYAFESQQPRTAASKLEGLRSHYAIDPDGARYFELHAATSEETDVLARLADSLTDDEFADATEACTRLAKGMWRALDGVYQTT